VESSSAYILAQPHLSGPGSFTLGLTHVQSNNLACYKFILCHHLSL